VSGVSDNFPPNSTIQLDAIFNYALFLEKNPKLLQCDNNNPSTYVLLKKGTNEEAFNKKITGFVKTKTRNKRKLYSRNVSPTHICTITLKTDNHQVAELTM
jgi:putative ABC transport system permease protein